MLSCSVSSNLNYDCKNVFLFLVDLCRSMSPRLGVKISHTVFQMKMEDMPLSGPDNTKLEVAVM